MSTVSTPAPARMATPRDQDARSLGDYFDNISRDLGFEVHGWQSYLNDLSTQIGPRENVFPGQSSMKLAAQYVGAMVGRQSGKTNWSVTRIVGQCELASHHEIALRMGLRRIAAQHVVYTAQTRSVAVDKWREHVGIIQSSPLYEIIEHVGTQTGREVLTFCNGSTYRPVTPNRNGARGLTTDLVIVDEALAHPAWLLGVLRPTMAQRHSAFGCIGAQFVVISNAGTEDSELLNHLQALGHEAIANGKSTRVWAEWSMEPGSDPLDPATWARTLPTFNQPNGIAADFLREEAESMKLEDFMREYLCVRIPKSQYQLIASDHWAELYRHDVFLGADIAVAVDITPDRQRASVVAAGPHHGYLPIEVLENRSGTDWVLDYVTAVVERNGCPVVIDTLGPAATLILPLEARGVEILPLASRQVADAAALFYDATMAKRIAHLNDSRLNDAIKGVSKRAIGERWGFDRRGLVDISPLVAASFAVWAVETDQIGKPAIY